MAIKFQLREGHEIRGMMIRLYPTAEQIELLKSLESDSRYLWNWLVKQAEDVLEARAAHAIRTGLVPPRPTRPNYEGLEPEASKALAAEHRKAAGEWHALVREATSKLPGCEFRSFKELLAQFTSKHDYQMLKKVLAWREVERGAQPGAAMLQALTKNYFQKADRRKKFRKKIDAMPLQTRTGKCFQLGDFGSRRGKPFYDCQISFNGLKIRGRLPGKVPEGRVLEGTSIREQADGWWASIKQEVPIRVLDEPVAGSEVGIDVGLDIVAAISDASGLFAKRVENKRGKELSDHIAVRQALKKPVGRLHLRAARQMKHVLYNKVVKPLSIFETIKIEKLSPKIGQMGSRKVSSMRQVAELLRQRYGARVREVMPHFTSQDCSQCGHRSKESWSYEHGRYGKCPVCGYSSDRDLNAARNIAAKDPIPLEI